MRRGLWVAALTALVAGCKAKHEATSGKEWLRKYQAAAKNNDADTCWKMISRESQGHFSDAVKNIKETLKSGGPAAEMFRKGWQLEKDIAAYSDEELAKKMLMRKEQEESVKSTFVEEKAEGNNVLLTVDRGGARQTMVLIKEEGSLKYDFKATMEKNAP